MSRDADPTTAKTVDALRLSRTGARELMTMFRSRAVIIGVVGVLFLTSVSTVLFVCGFPSDAIAVAGSSSLPPSPVSPALRSPRYVGRYYFTS